MINVSQDIIDEYLRDSSNKELIIEHEGIDPETVNYYTGDVTSNNMHSGSVTISPNDMTYMYFNVNESPTSTNIMEYMHAPLINDWDYLIFSFYFRITSASPVESLPSSFQIDLEIDNYVYNDFITKDEALAGTTVCISIPRTSTLDAQLASATFIGSDIWLINSSASDLTINLSYGSISLNYTRTTSTAPSTWTPAPDFSRIRSLNPYTVNNETLLYESFTLTESLCSQDNLKFGLCEAAHIEFETTEARVKVGDELKPHISLTETERQEILDDDLFAINWIASTGGGAQILTNDDFSNWIQVLYPNIDDYYADWSDYVNELELGSPMHVYEERVIKLVFSNVVNRKPTYFKFGYGAYFGDTRVWYTSLAFYTVADFDNVYKAITTDTAIFQPAYGVMTGIKDVWLRFYDENHNVISAGTMSADISISMGDIQYRIGLAGHTMPEYSQDDLYYANGTLDAYIAEYLSSDNIPLGKFYVTDVQREFKHNFVKRKVEAYDRLVILEQNAADWYTRYMYGIDCDGYTSNGFQFARQIYSTYLNYAHEVGLEPYEYHDILVDTDTTGAWQYVTYKTSPTGYRLSYNMSRLLDTDDIDPSKLYKVVITYKSGVSLSDIPYYTSDCDALGRGVFGMADVLVEETLSGGGKNRFLCNNGDYFALSDDCVGLVFYIPALWEKENGPSWIIHSIFNSVALYKTEENKPRLVNDSVRLCYYNYGTKEIFACDSSITGRDVVRSLLEVCGCFYRLDRENGLPEFVYPTKGGLYPSNTLYPADDLYPRSGTDEMMPMSKYLSLIAEDYTVKDYGRIQILKDSKSSDTVSVVEWQYEGNPNMENTYIIDDNIFYCADDMMYDYDGMPEVSMMLAGMWNVISNLGYVPNETQALGAPWLECGDRVGLLTYDGGIETFVFRRTLKGIQNLRDTYESYGDEVNATIDNFGYTTS